MKTTDFYDKDFRQNLLTNPKATMSELNSEFISDVEVVVKKNTVDVIYFVMPAENALEWSNNDMLDSINAAGCASSASSTGSLSSLGSASSTFSSAGTASTAGTAGSK